jgi:hypothetical protein
VFAFAESSDNEEEEYEQEDKEPRGRLPSRQTTASARRNALEEMKRRRAKGRASDDHRKALEFALAGGGGPPSDGSGSKSDEKDSSRGGKERKGRPSLSVLAPLKVRAFFMNSMWNGIFCQVVDSQGRVTVQGTPTIWIMTVRMTASTAVRKRRVKKRKMSRQTTQKLLLRKQGRSARNS